MLPGFGDASPAAREPAIHQEMRDAAKRTVQGARLRPHDPCARRRRLDLSLIEFALAHFIMVHGSAAPVVLHVATRRPAPDGC